MVSAIVLYLRPSGYRKIRISLSYFPWNSRYIVDYKLSSTLEKGFVLRCLRRALERKRPEIINSDQDGHFTNPDYIALLEEHGVKISMDGKGPCRDNARAERLFAY